MMMPVAFENYTGKMSILRHKLNITGFTMKYPEQCPLTTKLPKEKKSKSYLLAIISTDQNSSKN